MKFLQLVALFGTALAMAVPPDLSPRQTLCTAPRQRKSWSQATDTEKQAYIDAVLCLHNTPSKLNLWNHQRLSEDFTYVHAHLTFPADNIDKIHGYSNFLPWHRYFVHMYEKALQDECGYAGMAMYWDWLEDYADLAHSSVFDPVLGFGGNGVLIENENAGMARVMDGPFNDTLLTYIGTTISSHFLSRNWRLDRDMFANALSPEEMEWTWNKTTHDDFRAQLENNPHAAIHQGVGGPKGDLGDGGSSPNDPLFFLHHTQVDRIWWIWQQSVGFRWHEYNGNGLDGNPVSLNDPLPMLGLAPDGVVGDYIYTMGGKLCYGY
ncbi:hypothetical protein QBC34DRAFT_452902 [Podospora aff. communis PSN243]|uniref:Tyrosinase copper-binding domain-containing protein n=1 Tax=Podospora aff. communis PSN243 TaxID=3040156 RepID=A0AAV9G5V3_9PEZI|nr:hypothetical protein QBC34DRAFT_452902 [Podospora aff. communis PSN243]